jgi:hypothetical protein
MSTHQTFVMQIPILPYQILTEEQKEYEEENDYLRHGQPIEDALNHYKSILKSKGFQCAYIDEVIYNNIDITEIVGDHCALENGTVYISLRTLKYHLDDNELLARQDLKFTYFNEKDQVLKTVTKKLDKPFIGNFLYGRFEDD